MPTYEFKCQCGESKEISLPLSDDPDAKGIRCSICKKKMKRTFAFGSIKFNGSGFYRTDS